MKRLLGSVFAFLILYLFQTTVLNGLDIAGVKPNAIIMIVALIGYRYGKIPGILMGFFSGLFLDLTEGNYLGYYALLYLLIGYLVGFTHRLYNKNYTVVPIFIIGFSDFLLNLMFFISGFLVRNRLDFTYYLFRIILPEFIYTLVLAVFLYKFLNWFYSLLEKKKAEKKEEAKGGKVVDR